MFFENEAKGSIQHWQCPAPPAACGLHCILKKCFSVLTSDDTVLFLGLPGGERLQNAGRKEGKISCASAEGHRNVLTETAPWHLYNWEDSLSVHQT